MWGAAIVAIPAGLVLLTSGCLYDEEGSGDMATVRYQDLDDVEFTGIAVLDDLDVAVVVDPWRPQSARVTIDDNLLDRGYASVHDGVLELGYDGLGDVEPSQTPRVVLTVHSLETIENHGDGSVVAMGVDGSSVDIVNTGDGDVAVPAA
jgi:Putative auto-transporter adhesin, head GIN domain